MSSSTNPLWATVLIALGAAFVGSLVGGFAAYKANIEAEKRRRQGLTKIRRKAKVHTPVRAELTKLRDGMTAGSHLYATHVARDERLDHLPRQTPELWRWKQFVEDGRATSVASNAIQSKLGDVEAAANAFNTATAVALPIVKARGEALVAEIGGQVLVPNWHLVGDFRTLVREDQYPLRLLDPPGSALSDHRAAFFSRWGADEEAQQVLDAVRAADAALALAVKAAIDELDVAMKSIAEKYEQETPDD